MTGFPRSSSGRTAADIALEAAGYAGTILLDRFSQSKRVKVKGRGNVVTETDIEVETAVKKILQKEYPRISVLAEESGGDLSNDGWLWIIDPLDGTRNFASNIPHFATVIALAYKGEVQLGITHDPIRNETFHALRGQGAFLNGQSISVSQEDRLAEGILGLDLSYDDQGGANSLDIIKSIWPGMQTARIFGSDARGLAYLAAGRLHVFFHHKLEPWDQASGLLIVEEAGGMITDRRGQRAGLESDGIIAASPNAHAEFTELIKQSAWRGENNSGN